MGDWLGEARGVPVGALAERLGLVCGPRGSCGPCPVCRADRRGHADRRGPLGLRPDGRGWVCHRCGARGDGPALVAACLSGSTTPSSWAEVAAWLRAQGVIRDELGRRSTPSTSSSRPAPLPRRAEPEADPPPARLPLAEVRALWECAGDLADARPWLAARARDWPEIDDADALAEAVVDRDLARELPLDAPRAGWARMGGRLWAAGWPLVLPCFDARGELVALRARRCAWVRDEAGAPVELRAWATRPPVGSPWRVEPLDDEPPKEISPAGSTATRGTVYADPIARAVLGWPGHARPGAEICAATDTVPALAWDGRALVVEGGVDWLRRAAAPWAWDGARWTGPAVLGVWVGAWPPGPLGEALADRLREAELVIVATDPDPGGDRIAGPIFATLAALGVPFADRTRPRSPHA